MGPSRSDAAQFKSARPDHSSSLLTNVRFGNKALLPTASTPRLDAPKRSAGARIKSVRWVRHEVTPRSSNLPVPTI
jgi:hypothetical protein